MAPGAPEVPVTHVVSVASISGSAALSGRNNWIAYADVRIRDQQGNPVPNAKVSGAFAPGGAVGCTTASTGTCRLASSALSRAKAAFTDFSVTSVIGSNLVYDTNQNGATRIRINRP